MILTDIKRYVVERGPTTTGAVAAHFDLETDAAQAMLETLARRGGILVAGDPAACASGCGRRCSGCGDGGTIWCGTAGRPDGAARTPTQGD